MPIWFPAANAASVDAVLETGRTHQIRGQFSDAGFPVLSDSLYGTDEATKHPAAAAAGRIALHVRALTIFLMDGSLAMSVEAALPPDSQYERHRSRERS